MQNDNKIQLHIPKSEPIISSGKRAYGERDTDEWVTGTESITDAEKSYLKILSDEAGETFDDNLSKAEASKRIGELQLKTGRGLIK